MEQTSSDDDGLGAALSAIRPDQTDVFARSLRAAVQRNLVGATGEPFRLGRFTVLEPLGGGGMGVVFIAYDPDLDRKIALKVLRNHGERGRREVLREGRALARLKHPNVVTVYEVGVLDEHVFVAMEYVEGKNLREWLRGPRTAEATLARLVEAGRGLAAAHAVDLVHRDVKPENLVIDGQGEHARVIDFGLARLLEELPVSEPRAGVDAVAATVSARGGTPAYMAPERLSGAPGDHRADQYSFCVTCWEALFGARPTDARPEQAQRRGVPGWVRRVLERGLAREPGQRWPSMAALLAALERGRRRARMGWILGGVVALAAVGVTAEGLRRREVAQRVAACEASGAAIEAAWNDETRGRLRAAFAGTGVSYAGSSVEKVIPRLDEYAQAWQRGRADACMNNEVHARWSADTAERAIFCLDERQLEMTALVAELEQADGTVVRKAVRAVASLKPIAACMDEGVLARLPAPPVQGAEGTREIRRELARARSLALAGKFAEAAETAAKARTRVEQELDWPPLWASARALEGSYLDDAGKYPEAETASKEAYFAAARAGAWGVAAEAATKLIIIVGTHLVRRDDGRAWGQHAELALAYAGDWSGMIEAQRLSGLAYIDEEAGAFAEARALHERALALREKTFGPDHPEVAMSINNLGNVAFQTGAYADARTRYERVLAIWEQALGADHPHIAASLSNLGNVRYSEGDYAAAAELFERSLASLERTLGPDHPQVTDTMNNLAAVYGTIGERVKARELFSRVVAAETRRLGADHVRVADLVFNIATIDYQLGKYDESLAQVLPVIPIQEKGLGLDHPRLANSLILVANIHAAKGAPALARPLYERALAIQEKSLGPESPVVALTLVQLADVLLGARRFKEVLPLAERAVRLCEAFDGDQAGEAGAHFALARALAGTNGDRTRALAEATKARELFSERTDPRVQKTIAEIDAWMAEQTAK